MDSLLKSKALLSLADWKQSIQQPWKKNPKIMFYIILSIYHITHIKPVFFHLIFFQDISCYLLTYITDANFRTW